MKWINKANLRLRRKPNSCQPQAYGKQKNPSKTDTLCFSGIPTTKEKTVVIKNRPVEINIPSRWDGREME